MKHLKHITAMVLILVPYCVNAQNREVVQAVSGEDLAKKVSYHIQYLFPEFTDGNVYYTGQPRGAGKMNYNMLLGEMQFIDTDRTVYSLSNVQDVIMVTIDNHKFYPFNDKEFVEELLTTDKIQLQVRRKGKTIPRSKEGAYGIQTSTSSVTTYNSVNLNDQTHQLTVKENVMITVDNFYYLVSVNNKRILVKNQKTFTKLFPLNKAQIETYIKEHNIRFDDENDLKNLVEYCSKL